MSVPPRFLGLFVCLSALTLGCGPGAVSEGAATSTDGSDDDGSESDGSENGSTTDTGEACPEPIVYEGTLLVEDASELPNYDCVVEITGYLNIGPIETLQLDAFPRLERVGRGVTIVSTESMVEIAGFPELREVESMRISGHVSLERISGFAKLEHVVERLTLDDMPMLTSIEGLAALTTVGFDLWISRVALESLDALHVESIGEGLQIDDCDALVDLSGLDNLTELPQTVIQNNDGLVSLAGLEQVTQTESLSLIRNAALVNLDALANLEVITGSLHIAGNPELASLAGLVALDVVDGNFELVDNDALAELDVPEFPMMDGWEVNICENDSLVWLPTMLMPTAGHVSVIRNESLPNATALEFATALGHPNAKIAANEDVGAYPADPCPSLDDGVCDEPTDAGGDPTVICDIESGNRCCELGGPTGLCLFDFGDCTPSLPP